MDTSNQSLHRSVRGTIWAYLGILVGVTLLLGVLHYHFAHVRVAKVYWFNFDKERNFHTWFKGSLLFLYGCAALIAYCCERKRNAEGTPCFRVPILRSEEHTSELQSRFGISYAVFCL